MEHEKQQQQQQSTQPYGGAFNDFDVDGDVEMGMPTSSAAAAAAAAAAGAGLAGPQDAVQQPPVAASYTSTPQEQPFIADTSLAVPSSAAAAATTSSGERPVRSTRGVRTSLSSSPAPQVPTSSGSRRGSNAAASSAQMSGRQSSTGASGSKAILGGAPRDDTPLAPAGDMAVTEPQASAATFMGGEKQRKAVGFDDSDPLTSQSEDTPSPPPHQQHVSGLAGGSFIPFGQDVVDARRNTPSSGAAHGSAADDEQPISASDLLIAFSWIQDGSTVQGNSNSLTSSGTTSHAGIWRCNFCLRGVSAPPPSAVERVPGSADARKHLLTCPKLGGARATMLRVWDAVHADHTLAEFNASAPVERLSADQQQSYAGGPLPKVRLTIPPRSGATASTSNGKAAIAPRAIAPALQSGESSASASPQLGGTKRASPDGDVEVDAEGDDYSAAQWGEALAPAMTASTSTGSAGGARQPARASTSAAAQQQPSKKKRKQPKGWAYVPEVGYDSGSGGGAAAAGSSANGIAPAGGSGTPTAPVSRGSVDVELDYFDDSARPQRRAAKVAQVNKRWGPGPGAGGQQQNEQGGKSAGGKASAGQRSAQVTPSTGPVVKFYIVVKGDPNFCPYVAHVLDADDGPLTIFPAGVTRSTTEPKYAVFEYSIAKERGKAQGLLAIGLKSQVLDVPAELAWMMAPHTNLLELRIDKGGVVWRVNNDRRRRR